MACVGSSLPSFEVLGSLRVWVDGQERAVSRPAVRRLLGALLLTPDRLVDRARLIEFVWGPLGCEPAALHSAVYRLREWLRPTGLGVVREGDGYRIEVLPEQVDASRFRIAVAGAREEPDPDRRTDLLLVALDLWRGPVLAEALEWPHALPAVAELQQARIDSARELAEAAVRCGRAADAADHLERLAQELPYDETVNTQLITLLGHAGRRAEGLRCYEVLRRRLADDLGVDPGPGLRRAHVLLLGEEKPAPGPPPAPICLLPADLPDFTGREDELAVLDGALTGEKVVAISGMPGAGKTALAVRAAHRLRDRFPDGQLFADLHAGDGRTVDAGQVLGRWLRVLGEEPARIPDDLEARAELMRARLTGRRVLIVLDDVADVGQIGPLLPAGAPCAAIVTSRADLAALYGMVRIQLSVMSASEAIALVAGVIGPARVAAEADPVRRLVTLCGGLPLALRIAGARLAARPHWTVARLAGQLEQAHRPLDHLAWGSVEVRAVLDVAYRALDAPERRLLRLLGLLDAPDVAAWAAAALLDGPLAEAEESLERLADARLLEAVRPEPGDQIRYRAHDLVRAFARERAEAEETPAGRDAALLRALGGWLALTEDAYCALWEGDYISLHGQAARWRPREGSEHLVADPLRWYDSERAAIVAAVGQAARIGAVELSWDLAGSAMPFFEARSHHDEWRQTHAIALAAALRAGDDQGAALMSEDEALLDNYRGDFEQARRKMAVAIELFERLGYRGSLALAAGLDARIDLMQGRLDGVQARYEQALDVLREREDRGAQFLLLGNLGELHIHQGRPDLALSAMEQAFDLAHTAPAMGPHYRAKAHYLLGEARLAAGDLDGAEDVLAEARRHAEQAHIPQLLVSTLLCLGLIRLRRDRLAEAESLLNRALTMAIDIGEFVPQVRVLLDLSRLYHRRGDVDAAFHCLTEALALSQTMRAPLWQAHALNSLAALHEDGGEAETAQAERLQAAALLKQVGPPATG